MLIVAQLRPLDEYGRETLTNVLEAGETQPCDVKLQANNVRRNFRVVDRALERLKDSPELISQQKRLCQERELIDKLAVTTGQRKSELASLTIGQFDLGCDFRQVQLNATDE